MEEKYSFMQQQAFATRAQWNICNDSLIQQMLHFAANIQIIHKEAVFKTCRLFIIAQWTLHANVF